MVKLEAAVSQMDDVVVKPPPPMIEIGKRLRLAFERSRPTGYADLSRSELRKLPFAYWLSGEPCLINTDPDLVRLYWTVYLPEALQSNPRRVKRWLSPLFFTYCERFDSSSAEFRDFATNLLTSIQQGQGLFAEKLRYMHRTYDFFNISQVTSKLAESLFLGHQKTIDAQMVDVLLWPRFAESGLGHAVFKAGLFLPVHCYRETQTILRLMEWNKRLPSEVVKTDLRVPFADALLGHWGREKPAQPIKNVLIEFFMRFYGDPRLAGHRQFQWQGVSPQATGAFLNWLTGDTLRGFMKVLEITADDIWEYRQKFWMAYYEKGYIDEAWLALGRDALGEVRRLTTHEKGGMGHGTLEGGAAKNQSVLLLKMGNLLFVEWSHNGSLRAYEYGLKHTPQLYQRSYSGEDLRVEPSMDFHDGWNMNPSLVHSHSDKGTWQRKARDFIRAQTGVTMSDREIL